jgi:hypothetical protein
MPLTGTFDIVWRKLECYGLLLLADPKLPSVAGLIAGETLRGSWWGHPRGKEIYAVSEELASRPDVLLAKLVSRKVTFVHRALWPSLYSVACSHETWQMGSLMPATRALFARIESEGELRSDQLDKGPKRETAKNLLELEWRLLVHTKSVHTEAGSHAKAVESWRHWHARVGLLEPILEVGRARKLLEDRAAALSGASKGSARLPWML